MSKQPAAPAGEPPSNKSGNLTSSFRGKTAAPLPDVGACPNDLPKPSPLTVKAVRNGTQVQVNVSADVYGDVRPVRRAVVSFGGQQAKTDDLGNALLTATAASPSVVMAAAGDTFLPAQAQLTESTTVGSPCPAKSAVGQTGGGALSPLAWLALMSAWVLRRRRPLSTRVTRSPQV